MYQITRFTLILITIDILKDSGTTGQFIVSTNKPANQSTEGPDSRKGPAGLAVDGNTDPDFNQGSCTHTSDTGEDPWWMVDLEQKFIISRVEIYNRGDCCGNRLKNFEIRVGNSTDIATNSICATHDDEVPKGGKEILTCGTPIYGRYVSIQKKIKGVLTLCEVKVFGQCPAGYFGPTCDRCYCKDDKPCDMFGYCDNGCTKAYYTSSCNKRKPQLKNPPRVTERSTTYINIAWDKWSNKTDLGEGEVGKYTVKYKLKSEENYPTENKKDVASFSEAYITDLKEGTAYDIRVFSWYKMDKDMLRGLPSPKLSASTCGNATGGATNIRLSSTLYRKTYPSLAEIKITWEDPAEKFWGCDNIKQYKVLLQKEGGSSFEVKRIVYDSDAREATLNNLRAYTNYQIQIVLVNSAEREGEPVGSQIRTAVGSPDEVANVSAKALSGKSIRVHWDKPQQDNGPITAYYLRYSYQLRTPQCNTNEPDKTVKVSADSNSHILTDLTPYADYLVHVSASTMAGNGSEIDVDVQTNSTVPSAAPIFKEVTILEKHRITVNWYSFKCEFLNGQQMGYDFNITSLDLHVPYHEIKEMLTSGSQYTFEGLVPYVNYSIQIRVLNTKGPGPWSKPIIHTTREDVPREVENVKLIEIFNDKMELNWENPKPPHGKITGYEVEYWEDEENKEITERILEPKFTIEGLQPNTNYTIAVRAFTSQGGGNLSKEVQGFTREGKPGPPQYFSKQAKTDRSLSLQWTAPKRTNGIITKYTIVCSVAGNTRGTQFKGETVGFSYTLQGLQSGTEYHCRLMARTSAGYGQDVSGFFYTAPAKPKAPPAPEVVLEEMTDTSVTIKIEMVANFNSESKNMVHRIVVDKVNEDPSYTINNPSKRDTEIAGTTTSTCNFEKLTDYYAAQKENKNCYIAAELDNKDLAEIAKNGAIFVIGSNETVKEYFNAPLEEGAKYELYFGVVVTVDGTSAYTYSKLDAPVHVMAYKAPEEPHSNQAGIVAGVMVAIVACITIIIVSIFFVVLRKKQPGSRFAKTRSFFKRKDTEKTGQDIPFLRIDPPSNTTTAVTATTNLNTEVTAESPSEVIYENINQDNVSHAIPTAELWDHVTMMKKQKDDGFKQEYDKIPMGFTAAHEVASKPENKVKNRFLNIVAYDHSRVLLDVLPGSPHSDYINACYIDGYKKPKCYIAAQGPSLATIKDFWRMLWEKEANQIVMVTNLTENAKKKCEQYWPEEGSKMYGSINVTCLGSARLTDFSIRTFQVTKDDQTRIVQQFHFTSWPDHRAPGQTTQLLAFRRRVRQHESTRTGPLIIHCSAGVGRSGTFIAIDQLLEQAKTEEQVDIFNTVQLLRTQRVNMVQTLDQYIFVYDAILEAVLCGDTVLPCPDFRQKYNTMLEIAPDKDKSILQEQFELLEKLCEDSEPPESSSGFLPDNMDKNRSNEIIPSDRYRPYISTVDGGTDYINAVYVYGYRTKDAYILTQMPLDETAGDFWRMMYDHHSSIIVMVNMLDKNDMTCNAYWPEEVGASQIFGAFTVQLTSIDQSQPNITERHFQLTHNNGSTVSSEIVQFQLTCWQKEDDLPSSKSSVVAVMNLVERWHQKTSNTGPITIHCMDGATRSGLYCAVDYICEQLRVEQEVDIFQAVRHLRTHRPQVISDMNQYKFLHEMALEYMDSFDTYANFK
ncbi:unnamed protein product [Owenia fusiformis]|uniref:protein-tyrosine-phosphatase n=1 Tax=Owenia fusiformis TaxID=6347 RepID=A0A8S4N1W9_OWEFU|nr:unnamed protein product [Owenia fusiformis]